MGYRREPEAGSATAPSRPSWRPWNKIGARCWRLGGTSNPDILALYRGRYTPLEIKSGKGKRQRESGADSVADCADGGGSVRGNRAAGVTP